MNSLFGAVRQVGYVVPNLEAATEFWTGTLGVGPFFRLPSYEVVNCVFAGSTTTPRLDVAIAYSGSLQIELIQPLDEQPSLYRELVQRPGLGSPHYVTHWVDDLKSAMASAQRGGAEVVQTGGVEGAGRFAYLRGAAGAPLFELLETTPMIVSWFGSMEQAAATWDGQRAIRPAFG
jgi:catechol 2,3-dioxygenase-like lactoylglutathione lyase family enzyme